VEPRVRLRIKDGSVYLTSNPDSDGFSAIQGSQGAPPVIQNPADVRYEAQIELLADDLSTILLATPVLDDVTVYWDKKGVQILSYVYDTRSF
jgi:hypothetical protein